MKNLVLFAIIIFSFLSCKKGEEDPVISFRSRESRLIGDWNLISGEVELYVESNYFFNSEYDAFIKYSENSADYVYEIPDSEIDPYTLEGETTFEFKEGGNFAKESSYKNEVNGISFKYIDNGKWSFLKGEDDFKNKERVEVEFNERESVTLFGETEDELDYKIEYELIELGKNRIQIEYEVEYLINDTKFNEKGELELQRD